MSLYEDGKFCRTYPGGDRIEDVAGCADFYTERPETCAQYLYFWHDGQVYEVMLGLFRQHLKDFYDTSKSQVLQWMANGRRFEEASRAKHIIYTCARNQQSNVDFFPNARASRVILY